MQILSFFFTNIFCLNYSVVDSYGTLGKAGKIVQLTVDTFDCIVAIVIEDTIFVKNRLLL